jgi:hypothetical protein
MSDQILRAIIAALPLAVVVVVIVLTSRHSQ